MSGHTLVKMYNRSSAARNIINANNALWKRYNSARILSDRSNKVLKSNKSALRQNLSRGNISQSDYNKWMKVLNTELNRRKKRADQLARKVLNQLTFHTGLKRIRKKYHK
jgi:uncharacterized HAD superfamily protein